MFGLNQKGLSPIGILCGLIIFAFVVLVGLKLMPAVTDYLSIKSTFIDAAEQGKRQDLDPQTIRGEIMKKFIVNSIRDFDWDKAYIGKEDGYTYLEFDYEVRTHLFMNVDVVLSFQHSEEYH